MPYADTEAMQKHLDEISKKYQPESSCRHFDGWGGLAQIGGSQYPEKYVLYDHPTLFSRAKPG